MAKRFLTTQKVVNLTSDPASGVSGEFYYNSSTKKLRFYDGSFWSDVDTVSPAGSTVTISDTPPSSPNAGDQWYESDTGYFFIYYDSYWVQIGGGGSPETYSFSIINVPSGTSPVADATSDTLNLTASNGVSITGDSSTDSVLFSTNATDTNTASTIVKRDSNKSFDVTSIGLDSAQITSKISNISVTTPVLIDSFSSSGYRGAEYIFQFSTNNTDFVISKIMLIHNGTDIAITEYGNVGIGGTISYDFNASFSLGNLELTVSCPTANISPVSIKFARTLFDA